MSVTGKSCCELGGNSSGTFAVEDLEHDACDYARARAAEFHDGHALVGTDRPVLPMDGEHPTRTVSIRSFALETTTVTNARFAEFCEATGYRSEAERIGWSFVFAGLLDDAEKWPVRVASVPWWRKVDGACWKAPEGQDSGIAERLDHPVVHMSWNDAKAFADWVGGRLPTEAEWEHAARSGKQEDMRFWWGDEEPDDETIFCNIWQGSFPDHNTVADGYLGTAPVDAFSPNAAGMFNMLGNVWEWTSDPFRVRSLKKPAKARNEQARAEGHRVVKGGSFLCHNSYCYRYRIAARIGMVTDSGASHLGFRVAYDRPNSKSAS